ncbi:MAG: hypothetical protein K1X94_26335 [Sandaracinaceae bacterium]|nr:hypothetical protein [Sandaracinaceae bacterium]
MQRAETIAGLLLAAFALSPDGAGSLDRAALAPTWRDAARERLAALDLAPGARDAALHQLAREAASKPLALLPSSPRAASLLSPLASPAARASALALPPPRRGYRPPPGLRDHLRRIAEAELRARRAEEERTSMEALPWPA